LETIGHQTIEDQNNVDEVEKNGPIKAVFKPYLGDGYYYWDNNIKAAHWWGSNNYGGNYMICESKLELKRPGFFRFGWKS